MALVSQLQADLLAATKQKQTVQRDTLRLLFSALKNLAITNRCDVADLSDSDVTVVLGKEIKKREESAAIFASQQRPDQAAAEQAELDVLRAYMPKQLSESQVRQLVDEAIASLGGPTAASMGAVMKIVMPQVTGRADGAMIQRMVTQALAVS